jgi:hypothetical protein
LGLGIGFKSATREEFVILLDRVALPGPPFPD